MATPRKSAADHAAPAPATRGKVRATFHLPPDLLDQVRNAVVALSGPPLGLTVTALIENAARAEVRRLEQEHNRGKPFPARRSAPRAGRPVGS